MSNIIDVNVPNKSWKTRPDKEEGHGDPASTYTDFAAWCVVKGHAHTLEAYGWFRKACDDHREYPLSLLATEQVMAAYLERKHEKARGDFGLWCKLRNLSYEPSAFDLFTDEGGHDPNLSSSMLAYAQQRYFRQEREVYDQMGY